MGRFGGALRDVAVADLAASVISALLSRTGIDPARLDEVLIGHCRQAGNGPNPGRTAAVRGGVPIEAPVATINMACPSGMKAVEIGAAKIMLGEADLVLAGGMESMSTMPYLLKGHRWKGFRFGDIPLLDGWNDSTDPLIGHGMGWTAENMNRELGVSREEQDEYAALSHEKAARAWEEGAFDAEVVPLEAGEALLARDETIRHPVDRAKMASLAPVFDPHGTVTAGNACSMADGCAFLLLASPRGARAVGGEVLAEIGPFVQAAVDPSLMGTGPAEAVPRLLRTTGRNPEDIALYEINEAFAVQAIANIRAAGLPPDRVNVHGGAIALGHPTGCSGARILVTLIHAMRRYGAEAGVASLCGAGGVTMATMVRRRNG